MASASNTQVLVVTADPAFAAAMRATFGASNAIELTLVSGTLTEHADTLDLGGMTVVVVDFDAGIPAEMAALARLMARAAARTPVITVTQSFDANAARTLVQMRVADFLVKPVQPLDVVRACAQAAHNPAAAAGVMCRYTLSVGWDGRLYDCDFNQMLDLALDHEAPSHIRDFDAAQLHHRRIVTRSHCYGCTAGAGSSCGGSVT